jgi:hypothetical protein
MNTNDFNTDVFNATPTFSSASGLSTPVTFGTFLTSLGLPIELRVVSNNYITTLSSDVNYVKQQLTNINYIKNKSEEIKYV